MSTPSRALLRWQACLGSAGVLDGRQRGQDTSSIGAEPLVVLLPASIAEVQECLRIAGECGISLHPISRGRNWGYGGPRVPRAGVALLSLERMDRLRHVDEAMAWVELEPGVRFADLAAHLRRHAPSLWPPRTGGPADGSVVGHALARGLGAGWPQSPSETVTGLELVLADGRVLRTGVRGALQGLRRAPLGPDAGGLFFQSSLAVVTAMTMQLQPVPPQVQELQACIDDDGQLAALLDALRPTLQRGLLPLTLQIFDACEVAALRGPYPWAATDGRTPLPAALLPTLVPELGGARWLLRGILAAEDPVLLEAGRARLTTLLEGRIRRLRFETPCTGATLAERPVRDGMNQAWWRTREPRGTQTDPAAANCGLRWLAVSLPHRSADLLRALAILESPLAAAGLDRCLSLRVLDGRALIAVLALLYDGEDEAARVAADDCHGELLSALAAEGFVPYRVGVEDERPAHDLEAMLRATFDPGGVLSGS
ncbi:MAG: FAD-binding oxidoreductase [Myxococcales bacterium]|nr:FAD-binding oxidoreductase [Myxococcales bacterium]